MTFTRRQLLLAAFHGMCREQPSSPGTPSPTSVKATLQQPTGQAETHAVPPQWSLGDFACGQRRPSPFSSSSMSSQHASETCSATADGKISHAAVHPAVSSSAQSVVSHSSAQKCSKSAVQDTVQDATLQYCTADFGMRKPVPSRVQTPSMTSVQHASRPGAKLPLQASASATASDTRTDPMRQVAFNQFSLADDLPSLDTLRQTEQPAEKNSTRHSPVAHGASAHTHKSQVIAQATTTTSAPDKGSSAPVHGSTAATKSARSVTTDAALPTKHATAAANISTKAAPSSKSATASGRAAKAPAKDTTSVVVSTTAPVKGATAPIKGVTAPVKGATAPVKDATAPIKGATAPVKGATAPVKGATAPVKGATAPVKGATAPVKGATLKDARGARERNTQASSLNIASTSSVTTANAFKDAPAANTSSTSLNLPDPNARPFYGSDSSDDFHSASSDAAGLRSSRLSPHSSPSQASTGSSYTTARSQTSSNSQASNNHSQLACMTSAADAPAGVSSVSSSSQGVKQASMAPLQVPLPPAEQRHNGNAERGQVSQGGPHSSRPPVRVPTAHVEPVRFQTAHVEPERHYKPQKVHQIKAPSQASHLASAEPRQYAQAERDHASRPLDRVRLVTAEPGHDAHAEHQSRPQGCKQTSRPYMSPQTDNIKPLKDVPAECDSMSSTHPGLGSGVDPNDPSHQAGLEEPVHSLDDALSSALQELLLTEDRQEFALSIQVGCNKKHICFLHMPHKAPVISFCCHTCRVRSGWTHNFGCHVLHICPCHAESRSGDQQR